jgi:hypothetical protein
MDERGVFAYFWLGGIPLLPKVSRRQGETNLSHCKNNGYVRENKQQTLCMKHRNNIQICNYRNGPH